MSTSRIFVRRIGTSVVAILLLIGFGTRVHAQVSTGTPPGSPFIMDGQVDDSDGDNVVGCSPQVKKDDPDGNSQELGPANTSDNKINPINTATTPMLGFTNPNGQVDLGGVWVATGRGTGTHANETFLYLAWERPDSASGSGQIGYEFFHSALPAECVYTGVNFVKPPGNQQPNQATQDLIADCNPWIVRQDGDFFINWDQDGNTLEESDITRRTFDCAPTGVADPEDPPTCVLGTPSAFNDDHVGAALSSTRKFGEMVINLTQTIFAGGGCTTLANVIPNTVTGNSDTADYKDTVFFVADPITNCGILKITKRLVDSAGKEINDASDPEFEYTLNRENGDPIHFEADGFSGTGLLEVVAAIMDDDTHTISDLVAGANYQLEETDGVGTGSSYELLSVICYDGTNLDGDENDLGNVLYDADAMPAITGIGPFTVEVPDGIEFTQCVITNRFLRRDVTASSFQTAKVYDWVTIDDITDGASNQSAARVTIHIFAGNDTNCSTSLGDTGALVPTYVNSTVFSDQKKIEVNTSASVLSTLANSFSGTGDSWKWALDYTGDALNNPITVTQSCGWEIGNVTFSEPGF